MRTRVAMMFGGKTVEHEVSVISGIQACMAMDTDKYEIIPVYMTKENEMYIGEGVGDIRSYRNIPELLKKSQRVIMINESGRFLLMPYPAKRFGGPKPVEFDVAFPVVHGTNVEDGALQGYLKTVGVPFVGPDVTASAISMDKFITKAVLKEHGIRILTAQLQDSHLYYDTDMRQGTAIVMGTESTGLTDSWRKAADAHIRIPMLGRLDSLNVSVSAAILLFEAVRQRN